MLTLTTPTSLLPSVSNPLLIPTYLLCWCVDDDRVATLSNFGYPVDYVKYTILENEANYCVTGYYLLGTDQNY